MTHVSLNPGRRPRSPLSVTPQATDFTPGTWRRTDVHLENPEYHTRWFFKYFLGKGYIFSASVECHLYTHTHTHTHTHTYTDSHIHTHTRTHSVRERERNKQSG